MTTSLNSKQQKAYKICLYSECMKAIKIAFIILIVALGGVLLTVFDTQTLGIGVGLILAIAGWIMEKQ